ncbi:DsbA family protein [Gordonia zhaorongruii]|uniref:DsbA family protein n=1 Tax=Gordonia zhaorongruii TaxID=2597659 RepID=UPI001F2B1F06|nr:thioredoxin domain-containing protein [Gordonia zhaorongruii]
MSKSSSNRTNPKYEPQAASNTSSYVLIGLGLLVVAALIIGGFIWQSSSKDYPPVDDKVLAENASFIVGERTAPETIDVFEDFACPHCKEFEEQSGQAIMAKVDEGKVRVRYHMLNFLDGESESGDFSSRGAGAILCVARSDGRDAFWNLHSQLFEKAEGDPSNAEIAKLAAAAGAGPQSQKCIADGAAVEDARTMADASRDQLSNSTGGEVSTPTVMSASTVVDGILDGTGWLDELIANPPKS